MTYPCGHCTDTVPDTSLLYRVDWLDSLVCGACKHQKEVDSLRASQEAAAASLALAVEGTWQSEQGKLLRAHRNSLLDANRWTVMPDSPLTVINQGEWIVYLKQLQSLTVTYPNLTAFQDTPGKWKWPVMPTLKYAPAATSTNVTASASLK